jgi:hypothetical protein
MMRIVVNSWANCRNEARFPILELIIYPVVLISKVLISKVLMGLLELRWHWIANDTKIRIGRTAVTPLQSWF